MSFFFQEIIEFPVLKVNAKTFETESVFHQYVLPRVHPELSSFCIEVPVKCFLTPTKSIRTPLKGPSTGAVVWIPSLIIPSLWTLLPSRNWRRKLSCFNQHICFIAVDGNNTRHGRWSASSGGNFGGEEMFCHFSNVWSSQCLFWNCTERYLFWVETSHSLFWSKVCAWVGGGVGAGSVEMVLSWVGGVSGNGLTRACSLTGARVQPRTSVCPWCWATPLPTTPLWESN